jgi:hypothetical protein
MIEPNKTDTEIRDMLPESQVHRQIERLTIKTLDFETTDRQSRHIIISE